MSRYSMYSVFALCVWVSRVGLSVQYDCWRAADISSVGNRVPMTSCAWIYTSVKPHEAVGDGAEELWQASYESPRCPLPVTQGGKRKILDTVTTGGNTPVTTLDDDARAPCGTVPSWQGDTRARPRDTSSAKGGGTNARPACSAHVATTEASKGRRVREWTRSAHFCARRPSRPGTRRAECHCAMMISHSD